MKKQIFLSLTFIFLFCFGLVDYAFTSVIIGPSCTVTANIIDKGSETQKAYGPDGKVSREYESEYLKLEIVNTKKIGFSGNCDFVKAGDIFKTIGGSNPDPLMIGDNIEVGAELGSAMGPSGVVSSIQWEPILVINKNRTLPSGFHLQSDSVPEVSSGGIDANRKFSVLGFVSLIAVMLVVSAIVLYFLYSRQRKILK